MTKKTITPEQQLAEIKNLIKTKLKEYKAQQKRHETFVKLAFGDPSTLANTAIQLARTWEGIGMANDLLNKLKENNK